MKRIEIRRTEIHGCDACRITNPKCHYQYESDPPVLRSHCGFSALVLSSMETEHFPEESVAALTEIPTAWAGDWENNTMRWSHVRICPNSLRLIS